MSGTCFTRGRTGVGGTTRAPGTRTIGSRSGPTAGDRIGAPALTAVRTGPGKQKKCN